LNEHEIAKTTLKTTRNTEKKMFFVQFIFIIIKRHADRYEINAFREGGGNPSRVDEWIWFTWEQVAGRHRQSRLKKESRFRSGCAQSAIKLNYTPVLETRKFSGNETCRYFEK